MGETTLQRTIRDRRRALRRAVADEMRRARLDAGLSIREVAAAAGLDWSHLAKVEGGDRELSQAALVAVACVLGHDPSIRLFPSSGPRVRDRLQARMIEALLAVLHPRWRPRLEVPVYRPSSGVIDLVLHDPAAATIIAGESHSLLHAVDGQLRWAALKTEALPSADGWPWSADLAARPTVSRLLLLRSTDANRSLVRSLPGTFRAAYHASTSDAWQALTTPDVPWPGPAIVWALIDGRETRILRDSPRGAA